MAAGNVGAATTMAWDRAAIIERLGLYPWLADEHRKFDKYTPKLRWGDLTATNATFCTVNYFDIHVQRPDFELLVPDYPGAVGGGVGPYSDGQTSTCAYGLGRFTQDAMDFMVEAAFGEGGHMQAIGEQTRHTFSNFVFTSQAASSAQTLNYNVVERFVDGVAVDGSNFLYRIDWAKQDGVWKLAELRGVVYGHNVYGLAPSLDTFLSFQEYIAAWTPGGSVVPGVGRGVDIDASPLVSRVPPAVQVADTTEQLTMLWDRLEVEDKTNLYGRLMDNHNLHCEVDGFCFGDLFADGAYICSVEHMNVSQPFPLWSQIYPGAPPINGKPVGGMACNSSLGSNAQEVITSMTEAEYGTGGVYQSEGHQPRHTVNNFVVTRQGHSHMTTQHYQVRVRDIACPALRRPSHV